MSGLPKGWASAELNDFALWGSGGTPSRTKPEYFGGEIPWVTISDLTDTFVEKTHESITKAGLENSAAKLAPTGSILVALYGSIGKLGIACKPITTNQAIAYASPDASSYDSKYLFHYLMRCRQDLLLLGTGVTQKNIYIKDLKSFQIPFAPIQEQTRIVTKLEELLSELDAGVAELKAAQKKLVQYRQSLLKAAVDGSLTAEWRKTNPPAETGAQLLERILKERRARWEAKQLAKFAEQGKTPPKDWQKKYPEPVQPDTSCLPALPKEWVWVSLDMLGEIASGVAKGTKRDATVKVREVPYLRVANVQRGFLDLSEIKTILATERDIAELKLQTGDVLFNEGGDRDKLGRGWVWRNEVENCIHQNHVFRMRPLLSEILPELISHHGNTFGKTWFQSAGKQTTNLASINMTMLRMFPVPLGPADEQRELLSQLDTQVEQIAREENAVELGLKQAAAQRQNILRAAFTGQLVPQDPNDEPASVLLERIRAERAAKTKPKARGRKNTIPEFEDPTHSG